MISGGKRGGGHKCLIDKIDSHSVTDLSSKKNVIKNIHRLSYHIALGPGFVTVV